MSGLEHSLQMGRVALSQRQLLGERSERYSPGYHAFFSRNLEEAVEPSGNGVGQRQVVHRGQRDSVSRGNVGANDGADGDSGIAGLGSRQNRKESELFTLGHSSPGNG